MSTKWNRPTTAEINRAIDYLGGTGAVCKLLKKGRTSVHRWRKGEAKVDYPSWVMMQNKLEKLG